MIYFIRNERSGAIKIGLSTDPAKRLSTLRVASPDRLTLLGTIPGGVGLEDTLHRRFTAWRLTGEWFGGDESFRQAIGAILADPPRWTVWDECLARGRCRNGLFGLDVRIVATGEVGCIGDTQRTAISGLILSLWKQGVDCPVNVMAEECELLDEWPTCDACRIEKAMIAERNTL